MSEFIPYKPICATGAPYGAKELQSALDKGLLYFVDRDTAYRVNPVVFPPEPKMSQESFLVNLHIDYEEALRGLFAEWKSTAKCRYDEPQDAVDDIERVYGHTLAARFEGWLALNG